MAFCQFCGREIDEGAACGCEKEREVLGTGAPETANNSASVAYTAPEVNNINASNGVVAEKKKNNTVVFIIVAAVAAILIIAIIVLLVMSAGGGYKKPVNDFVKAFNNGEGEVLVEAICTEKMIRYFEKEDDMDYDDVCDEFEDMVDEVVETWEDEFGEFKLSVKFEDKEELDEDEIEEIEEEYKDDGYRVKIKKAYELECTLIIKGEDDDDDEDVDFVVMNVEGEGWKLYIGSLNNIV